VRAAAAIPGDATIPALGPLGATGAIQNGELLPLPTFCSGGFDKGVESLLLVMSDADQVCRDGMVHIEPARWDRKGDTGCITRGDQVCLEGVQDGLPVPGARSVEAVANSVEACTSAGSAISSRSDGCKDTPASPSLPAGGGGVVIVL